jgi:hypothetical protein
MEQPVHPEGTSPFRRYAAALGRWMLDALVEMGKMEAYCYGLHDRRYDPEGGTVTSSGADDIVARFRRQLDDPKEWEAFRNPPW